MKKTTGILGVIAIAITMFFNVSISNEGTASQEFSLSLLQKQAMAFAENCGTLGAHNTRKKIVNGTKCFNLSTGEVCGQNKTCFGWDLNDCDVITCTSS